MGSRTDGRTSEIIQSANEQPLKSEVQKGVEHGNNVPRKFLRFAESFQTNHTRYVAFCENLSNHVKIYWNDRLIPLSPSLNLRKLNKNQVFFSRKKCNCRTTTVCEFSFCKKFFFLRLFCMRISFF